jgi:hypothetical protein
VKKRPFVFGENVVEAKKAIKCLLFALLQRKRLLITSARKDI